MAGPVQPSARALAALSLFATLGTLTEAAARLGRLRRLIEDTASTWVMSFMAWVLAS